MCFLFFKELEVKLKLYSPELQYIDFAFKKFPFTKEMQEKSVSQKIAA